MLTPIQKEQRRHGLGATDCAAVMGLSPYRTPYELWLIKTGRQEEDAILSEDRLRLRHAHEETVAREYAFQRGVKLKRVNQTVIHPRLPFMLCNLDRLVIGQRRIVECKTSTAWLRQAWGASGTDQAPIHYILQVQHQLACTGYSEADIAALIDIDDYRIFPTPRNDAVIQRLEDACERFWFEHVVKDVAPPPTTRGDLKLMHPLNNGTFIEATPDIELILCQLKDKKGLIKAMEADQDALELELIKFISAHDGIKTGDSIVATFTANKNGTRSLRIKERV